jgi:hypothetical protein
MVSKNRWLTKRNTRKNKLYLRDRMIKLPLKITRRSMLTNWRGLRNRLKLSKNKSSSFRIRRIIKKITTSWSSMTISPNRNRLLKFSTKCLVKTLIMSRLVLILRNLMHPIWWRSTWRNHSKSLSFSVNQSMTLTIINWMWITQELFRCYFWLLRNKVCSICWRSKTQLSSFLLSQVIRVFSKSSWRVSSTQKLSKCSKKDRSKAMLMWRNR